jgi:hypothetical protein
MLEIRFDGNEDSKPQSRLQRMVNLSNKATMNPKDINSQVKGPLN